MKCLICIFVLLFVIGCAISQQEQERIRLAYIEQNPQLSERIITCLRYGWICLGMTKEQVMLSKGKPGKITKSIWKSGERETWEYGYFQLSNREKLIRTEIDPFFTSLFHTKYLYFENGKLIGWQG